jgi:hypothetical protein
MLAYGVPGDLKDECGYLNPLLRNPCTHFSRPWLGSLGHIILEDQEEITLIMAQNRAMEFPRMLCSIGHEIIIHLPGKVYTKGSIGIAVWYLKQWPTMTSGFGVFFFHHG